MLKHPYNVILYIWEAKKFTEFVRQAA